MPDTEFIAVILLLVVAVIAGYFYWKRAQRRASAPAAQPDVRATSDAENRSDEA